jgi:hypothetical protein
MIQQGWLRSRSTILRIRSIHGGRHFGSLVAVTAGAVRFQIVFVLHEDAIFVAEVYSRGSFG